MTLVPTLPLVIELIDPRPEILHAVTFWHAACETNAYTAPESLGWDFDGPRNWCELRILSCLLGSGRVSVPRLYADAVRLFGPNVAARTVPKAVNRMRDLCLHGLDAVREPPPPAPALIRLDRRHARFLAAKLREYESRIADECDPDPGDPRRLRLTFRIRLGQRLLEQGHADPEAVLVEMETDLGRPLREPTETSRDLGMFTDSAHVILHYARHGRPFGRAIDLTDGQRVVGGDPSDDITP